MKDDGLLISRFYSASALLPHWLRETYESLTKSEKALAEEFRLRAGLLPSVLLPAGEKRLGAKTVSPRDLADTLEIATESSLHSSKESIRNGFVTGLGGHRIGICGTAIMKGGEIEGIRAVSSLSVQNCEGDKRLRRDVVTKLIENGRFLSTMVISPPEAAKRHCCADLVRLLSNRGYKVALADEGTKSPPCARNTSD